YGNLEKCIVFTQNAPDKFSSGTFLFDKKLNDVTEKYDQNRAKKEFDQEFKEREQKLIKEYRIMMEEALRGPSVFDTSSNITSGSSSKHDDR
ncbi:9535_t:CDS:2, partial [Racocetra fulgida]